MSRSRKKPRQSTPSVPEVVGPTDPAGGVWLTGAVTLFLVRLFVPAEGTDQGDTLWVAQLWFVYLGLWLWSQSATLPARWSFKPIDVGVLLMVAGHLLSGVGVLAGGGDRRAALNLEWEWLAFLASYVPLRVYLARPTGRRLMQQSILVACVVLSAWGFWQHFVWYPETSEKFRRLVELQDLKESGEMVLREDREEYDALIGEFGPDIVGMDDTGRAMLWNRVASSTEPIGRFALANTLAGLLVVGALGWLHAVWIGWRTWSAWQRLLGGIALVGVVSCLVLTKSRTAWLAFAVGLAAWWWLKGRHQAGDSSGRSTWKWGLGLAGCVAIVAIAVFALGGLDREVLLEAPKSLQYRWQYWTSTLAMLREQPFLGPGLGNFRQHYLQYKLPVSSEEILDPHNLFLDAWANGGLVGLAGLCTIIVAMALTLWRSFSPHAKAAAAARKVQSRWLTLLGVGWATMLLLIAESVLFTAQFDSGEVVLLGMWTVATLLLAKNLSLEIESTTVARASWLGLTLHLCGAGGIGMPAILQLWVILILLSQEPISTKRGDATKSEQADQAGRDLTVSLHRVGAVTCLMAALACVWTSTLPVLSRTALVHLGEAELYVEGRLDVAQQVFETATKADPLSPEPWRQLAQLHWTRWQREHGPDTEFVLGVEAQQEAIARDPEHANGYRTLGEAWLSKARLADDREAAEKAVEALQEAVERHPTSVAIHAQLARALDAAGDTEAVPQAEYALELHQLSHDLMHFDKMLPDAWVAELEKIAAGPNGTAGSDN